MKSHNAYKNNQIDIVGNKRHVISNYTKKIIIKSSCLSKITLMDIFREKIIIPNSVNYLHIYLKHTKMLVLPNSIKNKSLPNSIKNKSKFNAKKIFEYNSKIILNDYHYLCDNNGNYYYLCDNDGKYYLYPNKSIKNITNTIFMHTIKMNKLCNFASTNNTITICDILHNLINNKHLCDYLYLSKYIKNININVIKTINENTIDEYIIDEYIIKITIPKTIYCLNITKRKAIDKIYVKIIDRCYLFCFKLYLNSS